MKVTGLAGALVGAGSRRARACWILTTATMLSCAGFAQDAAPLSFQQKTASTLNSGIAPVNEEHERVAFVMPAFGVTNRQDAAPMTAKQKFRLAARQAFDPFVLATSAIEAGASQANNEFPEYGLGAAGFGKRYGAAMLDATSGGFASMSFCALLRQDPRYFRRGRGPIWSRTFYSAEQQFSIKSDRANRQINWSNLAGLLTSASLANAYYPPPNRGFGLTMNRFGLGIAWGVVGGIGDEFWPDVRYKLFHRKAGATGPAITSHQ